MSIVMESRKPSPDPVTATRGVDPLSIRRQALHAAATDRLRDMIVEGVLAPGDRLNERLLCEQLGISRTPLREAYKVLAARDWWSYCQIAAPSSRGCP